MKRWRKPIVETPQVRSGLVWFSSLFALGPIPFSCLRWSLMCREPPALPAIINTINGDGSDWSPFIAKFSLIQSPITCGRHSDWGFLLEWCDIQCILPPSLSSWYWIVSRKCPYFGHASFRPASLLSAAQEEVMEDWPTYASRGNSCSTGCALSTTARLL